MFCTTCGQRINDGDTFCTKCGTPVTGGAAGASATPAATGSAAAQGAPHATAAQATPQPKAEPKAAATPAASAQQPSAAQPAATSSAAAASQPSLQYQRPAQAAQPQATQPAVGGVAAHHQAAQPTAQPQAAQPAATPQSVAPTSHQAAPRPQAAPVAAQAAQPVQQPREDLQVKMPKQKKSKAPLIGGIVGVVVIAALVAVMVIVNPFGLGGSSVKASVNEYTWEELSAISDEIAAAGDESAALEVAKKYNLVGEDGKLDGSQVKDVELTDGTKTQVQIAGFAHDDKADGSGKAGITFIFTNAIGHHTMNPTKTSAGGWEESQLRSWLSVDGMNMLPSDLREQVVAVSKKTNNIGATEDESCVTATDDKLWLLSQVEIGGEFTEADWPFDGAWVVNIYNQEGSQYQLFRDFDVAPATANAILSKTLKGSRCDWWQRSPVPSVDTQFRTTSTAGDYLSRMPADGDYSLLPGFCL